MSIKGKKLAKQLEEALDDIAVSPVRGSNVTSLFKVPNGYRKRVGRYRILYTFHSGENLVRIWIIDIEKDTRKDYTRWMEYILRQL